MSSDFFPSKTAVFTLDEIKHLKRKEFSSHILAAEYCVQELRNNQAMCYLELNVVGYFIHIRYGKGKNRKMSCLVPVTLKIAELDEWLGNIWRAKRSFEEAGL